MSPITLASAISQSQQYAVKGIKLRVAVLLKGIYLSTDQLERAGRATFPRSDRVITTVAMQPRIGTIIISENTASGQTRVGPQAGFHDLRDALVGKKLGAAQAAEMGRERQPGLLGRLGVSGVKLEDIVLLETETL